MYRQFIDTPHLIFQIHDTQVDGPLDFPGRDILVLRELAERYAAIACLPVQEERRRSWKRLNDLQPERPLIWVNEVCWKEMDLNPRTGYASASRRSCGARSTSGSISPAT